MSDHTIHADYMPMLIERVRATDLKSAARMLAPMSDTEIAQVLEGLSTGQAVEVLEEFPKDRRAAIAAERRPAPTGWRVTAIPRAASGV